MIDQPTRDEVKLALQDIVVTQDSTNDLDMSRKWQELELDRDEALLISTERRELITMRSRWSNWILIVIVAISVFDMLLIGLIGGGIWVFTDNFAIPLFIGESLVKLLGLAFLIVHFLFDHKSLSKRTAETA